MYDQKPILVIGYKTNQLDEFPIRETFETRQECDDFIHNSDLIEWKIYKRIG